MTRTMKKTGTAWIREIPADWAVVNIRALFSFGKGLPITKENLRKKGAPVVSYGQIHSKQNNGLEIKPDLVRYVDASYFQSNPESLVKQNEFIFADTSEDLDGCGNCVYVDSKDPVFAGYHTIILRNKTDLNLKYFAFLFQSDAWRKQIRERVTGVKLFSISQRILRETTLLLPPVDEQRRIVRKLSAECARIDAIIEQTHATVEEYKKLKQSIITQAVTKGIRPNRPMKDSGIEWIGEIPEDWEVDKIFRLFLTIGSGTTPKSGVSEYYGGNINWIQSGDINGRLLTDCKTKITSIAIQQHSALHIYSAPFIVIAMYGASIGNLSISQIDGCVNQACCVMQNAKLDIRFSFYALKVAKDYLVWKAVGGGQPNISQDTIKQLWLPVPSHEEQVQIVEFLDRECTCIDSIIERKSQFVEELTNYKKSLIYEYVTGKKEAC